MNAPLIIHPSILTCGGHNFNLLEPEQNEYRIEDIAHALSNVCRFAGHTREFYSVAQHSVLVSKVMVDLMIKERTPISVDTIAATSLVGLMHDAAEAYIGDITRPLKQLLPEYKTIEQRVEAALFKHFGIRYPTQPACTIGGLLYDNAMCGDMRLAGGKYCGYSGPCIHQRRSTAEMVKHADLILLATERRDLMPPNEDEWQLITAIEPMEEIINPWHPAKAEREFMERWENFSKYGGAL